MSMISEKLRKARQGVKEEDTPAAQALRLAAYGAASGRLREQEEQEAQGLQSLRLAAYGAAQDAALANARRPAPSYAGTLRAVPDSGTGTSVAKQAAQQEYEAGKERARYLDFSTGAELQRRLREAEDALSLSGGGRAEDAAARAAKAELDKWQSDVRAARGQETFGEHALNLLGDAAAGFMRGVGNPVEAMARLMELPEDALYWITGDERFNQDSPDRLTSRASKALTQSSEDTFSLSRPAEERPMLERALVQTAQAAGNMLSAGAIYGQAFDTANTAGLEAAANATPELGASLASRAATAVTSAGARAGLEILRNPGNFGISLGSGVNAYSEALGSGADFGQAVTNGFAKGLTEYFSNKLFSGTPFENNPAEKGYVTRLTEHIAQKIGKSEALAAFNTRTGGKVFNWVMDKTGEGMEEVVTAIADPLIDRLTYDEDADFATADELVEEFLGGILLSLAMSPAETLADNVERHRVGADLLTGETVGQIGDVTVPGVDEATAALIESGLESPEGTESRRLAETALARAQEGKEISARMRGELAAANAAQVASEESAATEVAQEERPTGDRGRQIVTEGNPRSGAAPTENEAARAAENVTLTAEDRASEVRRVAVEEAGLSAEAGDTLADIFTQAAPEGVDPAAFASVNGYFYQAGERGLPFDKVRESIPAGAWSAAGGTEEIAQYAYNRGRMKTLAQEAEAERRQREAERKAAERAQLQREAERNRRLAASEAGLHEDDFTRANLSAADARRIDETARLLGTPVYVVGNNEIGAGRAQGELAGGRAVLLEQGLFEGENAGTSAGLRIAGHEWGHRLKRLAPTEYGQVVEALRPMLTKEIEQKRHLYNEQNGLNYSDAELTEEAVNDRLGDMLRDGRILDEFIEEHRQERGLLQRMWEGIKSLARKLTGAEKRAAQSAEAKLRAALDAAATSARQESSESRVQSSEGTENAAQEGGEGAGSEFSLKEDSEGRELTEAQAAYFADSKAVDEDGRLLVLYHGTTAYGEINKFRRGRSGWLGPGIYLTSRKADAQRYADAMGEGNGSLYELFANVKQPLVVTGSNPVPEILMAAYGRESVYKARSAKQSNDPQIITPADIKKLQAKGYDGIRWDFGRSTEISVFSTEQIKRTDNLSPTGDPDIRYSLKEPDAATVAALQRENERLRERVEYWRGQTKQTRGLHLRYGDLSRLTGQLVKDYGAELDEGQTAALEESLRRLGRIMREDPKGLQYSEMLAGAEEVARELVQNARELVNDDEYQDYRDLRKWLRGQKLTISRSDAAGIADFNEWKKAHSAIRVGYDNGGLPIDTAYAELAEQFPGFFPEEIDNPTDQLERIGEILDSVGPVYENPYSPYMAAAIEEAGYDVLERIMDEDTVRPAAPTRADKQAAKYEARLDAKDEQIKDLRERYTWNVAQRVAQERAKRDSMIAAIKGHQAEVRENERNRRQESQDRDRLLRVARRLAKLKTTEANRAVINELIGDLDLVSKGLTTESIENLVKLREWYEGKTTEGSDNYDPDFIADKNTLDKLRRLEQRKIKDLTITEVRELTESLLNIEHEIRTAKKLIDSEDRRDVYYQALDIAQHMEDTKGWKKGVISGMLSPERFARRVTGYAEGDPLQRAMSGLSAGQRTMWDYQRRALQDVSRWTGNREFMRRWSGKDAQRIRIDGDDGLGHHVTATITPGMLASLYLHSMNDDNMKHVAKGGVTIPNAEAYRKGDYENAYRNATTMRLQRSQIQRLAQEHLSAEDRAFIRAIMRYFNETSKAALGETAEKLLGYSPFNVDRYFPISVDQNFLHTDFDSMGEDGSVKETLADPGYAQERKQDSKPIDLRDANDVLADAIRKHSQYVGLAIPVRNVNKLIKVEFGTYTEEGERVSHTGSLKKTLNKTFGKAAIDYLNQLMKDVQGNRTRDNSRIGDLIARMRSNYAGAVLTLNAGVAIKQAASYPTAAAVLKYRHLARALKYMAPGVKVDTDLIQRYTPLLWYRSLGYSSQEQGELQNRGRPIPKKLNWIQAMDVKTTAALWKAAEYQIAEERKDLQRGSDGFYKAVAELYNRVIEETQPNYSVMQRPEILRTTNELTKTLNMFKTQPFQNFNILYDAVGDWQAQRRAYSAAANDEARAEARKRMDAAKRKLGRALSSQLISCLVFALMQYAWDAFRRKDDKYKDKEGNADPAAWLKGIGLNMLGNGFGMLPFGSELLEWGEALTDKLLQNAGGDPFFEQKFYGFDASVLETMTNLATGAASLIARTVQTIQNATDSEKKTDWEAMVREAYDAAVNVSQALGIPVENVRKTLTAVAERVLVRAAGPYLGEYYAMRIADEPKSGNSRQYYDLLYRAMENDKAAYEELYKLFIDDGSGLFTHEKIRENMEKRMKAAQGVNSVTDLAERYEGTGYMSAEQQKRYDELRGPLTRSPLWREATKEQRGRVEDKLYQLAAETSTSSSAGTKLQEKIDAAGKAGISEGEYMLYLLALSMADEPRKTSGEYGTYTNDEQEAALDMLDGLSREDKSWLWMSTHDSDKNNPYK